MQAIFEHLVVKRLNFSEDDIKFWLLRDKVFKTESSEIDFDMFKKNFFPHLFQIQENDEMEYLDDRLK